MDRMLLFDPYQTLWIGIWESSRTGKDTATDV